jgi:hypothetical protein
LHCFTNSTLFEGNTLYKQGLGFHTPLIVYLVLTTNQGI